MFASLFAFLLQAAAPPPAVDSAGNPVQYVAPPDARAMAGCIRGELPAFDIVLACRTAAGDRLADCRPDVGQPAQPPVVTRFLACSAKAYRVRATGPDGKPVTGTTVRIPVGAERQP